MLLTKFWQIIDDSFVGKFIDKKMSIIGETNPQCIYVENISRFYKMPHSAAKFFCEVAVKLKFFRKKIAVRCPNQECRRIVFDVDSIESIPDKIVCETCEMLDRQRFEFSKSEVDTIEFYQLIDDNG